MNYPVGRNPFDGLDAAAVQQISDFLSTNPHALLQVEWIRSFVTAERVKALASSDKVRTTGDDPGQSIKHTVSYNLESLQKGAVILRPIQLINPVRAIERVYFNAPQLKVLSIGPRSELEIFSLYAAGFQPENVSALDLISYSPFVDLGDMHAMPYQDHAFDVTFIGWVMSYSKDVETMAREVVRVSKDRAIVAIGNDYAMLDRGDSIFRDEHTDFRNVDELLAPFGDHVGQVFFRHEPDSPEVVRKGQLMVVFEVLKDGAPLTAAMNERAVDRANPRRHVPAQGPVAIPTATSAPAPAPAQPSGELDIKTAALITGSLYALAKLIAAPKAEAQALLDRLTLSALDGLAPPLDPAVMDVFLRQAPDQKVRSGVGLLQTAGAQLARGDFADAVRHAQAAAMIVVDLLETGNTIYAMAICNALAAEVRENAAWHPVTVMSAFAGALDYLETGSITDWAHQQHVDLYSQSNGMFQQFLGWLHKAERAMPADASADLGSLLGLADVNPLGTVVETLNRDGYYSFGQRLPGDLCDRLTAFAKETSGYAEPASASPDGWARFGDALPGLEGVWLDAQDSLENRDIQDIVADPGLLAVARNYLGCEPLFYSAQMWWSLPRPDPSSGMAQLYHVDPDLNRTCHFFMYVSDVDEGGGPHGYVVGSHRANTKPPAFLQGMRRIPDDAMEQAYGRERMVKAYGPRGTILAGDTKAWHKGTNPTTHPRLILQVVFADTLMLGKPVKDMIIRPDYSPKFLDFVRRHPQVFAPRCKDLPI